MTICFSPRWSAYVYIYMPPKTYTFNHVDLTCVEVTSLVAERFVVIEDCLLEYSSSCSLVLKYSEGKTTHILCDQTLLYTIPVIFKTRCRISRRPKATVFWCISQSHGHLLHQTTFTPGTLYNFYTRHLLHQAPSTPDTSYTKHLLHKTLFTPDNFYNKQLLHQAPFTPETFCTKQLLRSNL